MFETVCHSHSDTQRHFSSWQTNSEGRDAKGMQSPMWRPTWRMSIVSAAQMIGWMTSLTSSFC